jgi:hypothetical protein
MKRITKFITFSGYMKLELVSWGIMAGFYVFQQLL